MIDAAAVIALHDAPIADLLWQTITRNHQCNAALWDAEDQARRTDLPAADIVCCKRQIDAFNQQRNDATERIDELLLSELGPLTGDRLNSETPGSMIDRMSILSLKIRAMRAQLDRRDVDADHLALCRNRLAVLIEQRNDLANCLDTLIADARAGRVRFKVFKQLKAYNDPRFRASQSV